MNIFLDTSSLFKLYHKEIDTDKIELILKSNPIEKIYLSQITKIELVSSIWKNVRIKNFPENNANLILSKFELDYNKFLFLPSNNSIIESAKNLISKYGNDGLRTLDSIQLASSIHLFLDVDLFITSDKLLKQFMIKEGLPTEV